MTYENAEIVALSPDGSLVATASRDANAAGPDAIRVRRVPDGALVAELQHSRVRDMALDRDNRSLAARGGGGLALILLQEKRRFDLAAPDDATAMAFSPDGRSLAIGGRGRVRLFDATTGEPRPIAELRLSSTDPPAMSPSAQVAPSTIGFSADGRLLAAAWDDERVTVWLVAERRLLLDERMELLQSLAFSPDGSMFAAHGRNQPVRVWDGFDAQTPREVVRIPHRENVRTLTFSPDGRTMASGSSDDVILLSPVRIPDLLAEATKRLHRNLTRREWSYYFGTEPYRCVVPALADCAQGQAEDGSSR